MEWFFSGHVLFDSGSTWRSRKSCPPRKARDRSREFNVSSQDTLLEGATKRAKLDDGSRLNVMDDSDLTDFIHHHAWFEKDEVALPREDRVYLLGHLTSQTPRRRRVAQSHSDLKHVNVARSFPVVKEWHELHPWWCWGWRVDNGRNASWRREWLRQWHKCPETVDIEPEGRLEYP